MLSKRSLSMVSLFRYWDRASHRFDFNIPLQKCKRFFFINLFYVNKPVKRLQSPRNNQLNLQK